MVRLPPNRVSPPRRFRRPKRTIHRADPSTLGRPSWSILSGVDPARPVHAFALRATRTARLGGHRGSRQCAQLMGALDPPPLQCAGCGAKAPGAWSAAGRSSALAPNPGRPGGTRRRTMPAAADALVTGLPTVVRLTGEHSVRAVCAVVRQAADPPAEMPGFGGVGQACLAHERGDAIVPVVVQGVTAARHARQSV